MFDHMLESSHRDDSNKWSDIGFGQEVSQVMLMEVNFTHLILSSILLPLNLHLYCSSNHSVMHRRKALWPASSEIGGVYIGH